MANFFQKLFGFANTSPNLNQGTPIEKSIPGIEQLQSSVANRQIGFGDQYVERATNPASVQRQANFDIRERPAIEENFASRGLGRSSLAARDVGLAYAQKERDINQLLSDAYLQNLQQGKTDQQARDEALFQLKQMEVNQANLAAQNEQERSVRNIGYDTARELQDYQGTNRALQTGLTLAAGIPGLPVALSAGLTAAGGIFGKNANAGNNFTKQDIQEAIASREAKPGRIRGVQ